MLNISRCSVSSLVSISRATIPTTPFIGVRISCDIVARNADLAASASSAVSLAERNLVSRFLRSVASRRSVCILASASSRSLLPCINSLFCSLYWLVCSLKVAPYPTVKATNKAINNDVPTDRFNAVQKSSRLLAGGKTPI